MKPNFCAWRVCKDALEDSVQHPITIFTVAPFSHKKLIKYCINEKGWNAFATPSEIHIEYNHKVCHKLILNRLRNFNGNLTERWGYTLAGPFYNSVCTIDNNIEIIKELLGQLNKICYEAYCSENSLSQSDMQNCNPDLYAVQMKQVCPDYTFNLKIVLTDEILNKLSCLAQSWTSRIKDNILDCSSIDNPYMFEDDCYYMFEFIRKLVYSTKQANEQAHNHTTNTLIGRSYERSYERSYYYKNELYTIF